MDLTRLAVDAGQFINRAVQYTEESLGQAEKTELDPGLEELFARADATKTWTDQIISQSEVLLQPNSRARLEDRLYEHLDWSVPPRPRALDVLGDQMTEAGLEMGSNTPYGTALLRCGEAQKQLGEAERKFVQSTNIHFLTPLRSFTEGEYRVMQDEHKMLVNKRLDLDIAKTRLRKAHEADHEGRNLNASPLDGDYLSNFSYMFGFLRVKWLKVWAQEISQAEMEQRICQSLFDRQSEITRRAVEGIDNTHTRHMRILTDFVEAQACYFDQCNQHARELQKQLASIPAVLCSNNWQSAISNRVHQPSVANHVANQVMPIPVVVHQIPDFDQDSWTANPPAAPAKTQHSFVTTQQNNNTNNNNTFFSDGPPPRHCSVISEVHDNARPSNLDQNSTLRESAAAITNDASPPSDLSGVESQTGNAVASGSMTINHTAVEILTANGIVAEPQTTNEATSSVLTFHGEDVQEELQLIETTGESENHKGTATQL